jgi:hypothetical protein
LSFTQLTKIGGAFHREQVNGPPHRTGSRPRLDNLDINLDIAAGRGQEEAVVQSTQIGAVNSWLRQPAEVVATAIESLREALAACLGGANVRLPGAMWLVSSAPA